MAKEKIIIVNENDEIIGTKHKDEVLPSDIYRVSALWVQNSNGDILLAQRSFEKEHHPGQWGPAVAGTVDEGETYEINIVKEAEEEISLTNCDFEKSFHHFRDSKHKHFTQWFFAIVDKGIKEFTIEPDEVEQIKWFKKEELLEEVKNNPDDFLEKMAEYIDLFNQ